MCKLRGKNPTRKASSKKKSIFIRKAGNGPQETQQVNAPITRFVGSAYEVSKGHRSDQSRSSTEETCHYKTAEIRDYKI